VIPLSRRAGPLFRQIYLALRRAILQGAFRGGERLPSTRDLAEQLRVSRTVVLMAYDQLLAEGFVRGRAGSGTYVPEGLSSHAPRRSQDAACLHLSRFGTSAAAAAPSVDFPRVSSRPPRYDFSYRGTPVENFPFETWRRILMRRARKAPVKTLDYGPSAGSLALREAIAAHLRRSRAVVCEASQIIVVNGSQQALDLAIRVVMERGDRVVIEEPQYQGAREVFRAAGARFHPLPVDRDGLNPDRLPRRARIAFVTPSHQLPTGTILPLSRRLVLLEWAKRAGAVVIEDDYDGEFHYEGQPVESMQGLDREGRVIYLGTFSRTIFPALRIGYMVAPLSLVPALSAAKWLADRHTATLEQETLAEFITTGAYERHLRRVRRANAARRRALLGAIHSILGDRVSVTGDGSGTHIVLWPRKREVSEEGVVQRAASMGVGVYGIAQYYLSGPSRPGLMLGYARLREQDIREGIRRLAEALPE
jgi:GntR family transcriptional regulator / MocR family aminotransferase